MTTPRKEFREVRDKFARDNGLPFGRILQRQYVLDVLESEGHYYRSRVFCPLVTLWAWLSQALSQDKSLREAVSRIVAHRAASGLPTCSPNSASYSEARQRFPLSAMRRMAREVGRKIHDSRNTEWDWRGRPVYLVDGTGFSMPDTPENKLAYPPRHEKRWKVAFPTMRAVSLISLATGAVVDLDFGAEKGKGTSELGLLRRMSDTLTSGDVLVADRFYPSYFTVAMLAARGVDLVSISHAARDVDFRTGQKLGPKDHIVAWSKSQRPTWMTKEEYDEIPAAMLVREFCIEIENRDGGKSEAIIVTTLTDSSIPQQEISDLYWKRWNCELDIRSIKHSMHMDVLRAKTPEMIQKEIWAHMLAWNLLRGVIVEASKRHDALPRQLSVKGAMQAVESFTPAMMAIDGNEAIYSAMLSTISVHRVANRPGRLEPRLKKRRPAWKHYMTKPRSEYHRRLVAVGERP